MLALKDMLEKHERFTLCERHGQRVGFWRVMHELEDLEAFLDSLASMSLKATLNLAIENK